MPFGRLRKRWEGNIRMEVRITDCEDGMWMELAHE
jgi:hypothetical protein